MVMAHLRLAVVCATNVLNIYEQDYRCFTGLPPGAGFCVPLPILVHSRFFHRETSPLCCESVSEHTVLPAQLGSFTSCKKKHTKTVPMGVMQASRSSFLHATGYCAAKSWRHITRSQARPTTMSVSIWGTLDVLLKRMWVWEGIRVLEPMHPNPESVKGACGKLYPSPAVYTAWRSLPHCTS